MGGWWFLIVLGGWCFLVVLASALPMRPARKDRTQERETRNCALLQAAVNSRDFRFDCARCSTRFEVRAAQMFIRPAHLESAKRGSAGRWILHEL